MIQFDEVKIEPSDSKIGSAPDADIQAGWLCGIACENGMLCGAGCGNDVGGWCGLGCAK